MTWRGNMQDMISKIKDDEQKIRKADLRLLQEQINPHFPVQYTGYDCLAD